MLTVALQALCHGVRGGRVGIGMTLCTADASCGVAAMMKMDV